MTVCIPSKSIEDPRDQGINSDIVYPFKLFVRFFGVLAVKTTWLAEKYDAFLRNRPFPPVLGVVLVGCLF